MGINSFEQLNVWSKAHKLVLQVYRQSRILPDFEKFGLQSQMRRAAVSVPANIAEGFKRRGPKDKARFIHFAQGSLEELRYYLILCRDLGYFKAEQQLFDDIQDVAKMLKGVERSFMS